MYATLLIPIQNKPKHFVQVVISEETMENYGQALLLEFQRCNAIDIIEEREVAGQEIEVSEEE
jgi:hypothetical protein